MKLPATIITLNFRYGRLLLGVTGAMAVALLSSGCSKDPPEKPIVPRKALSPAEIDAEIAKAENDPNLPPERKQMLLGVLKDLKAKQGKTTAPGSPPTQP